EEWIDDAYNREGRWLKLQLRSGLLMTNEHIASILHHKKSIHHWNTGCQLCGAPIESPLHMFIECTENRMAELRSQYNRALAAATRAWDPHFVSRVRAMTAY